MNLPADTDQLTLAQASALYAELEQRAAELARTQVRRTRGGGRRWAALAPVLAGLAASAALVLHHSAAGRPARIDLAALGVPAVPGQQVRSVARAGRSVTVTYRSGLIETVGAGVGVRNGVMVVPGRRVGVTVHGRRVILSGLAPATLRRLAGRLASGPDSRRPDSRP